jgi:predicted DNA-binding transcriptional regulator YafY
MRASRLLSILILLQMRGRLSADTLAREFEVSVRTIYRDIDQLSAAGVPVYAERGRAGGFALLDGYRTRLTGFTPAEADALLLAGVGGAAADLGMGADLAAAQLKLLASLPPDSGASAQRVSARFHLDPANWYSRIEPLEMLPTLAAAVWSDTRIRIRYESWKDVVMRDVDPLGLVLKGGVWYLVAAAKTQPRTYRVSNIQGLEILEARFKRSSRFDLARYWAAWARDFEARMLRETATVRLSPEGLRVLRELSPAAGEAADAAHRKCAPAGWIRADIPVESVAYASRQLLRIGADIEVLGPPALRDAIAREARRVADLYGNGSRRRPTPASHA